MREGRRSVGHSDKRRQRARLRRTEAGLGSQQTASAVRRKERHRDRNSVFGSRTIDDRDLQSRGRCDVKLDDVSLGATNVGRTLTVRPFFWPTNDQFLRSWSQIWLPSGSRTSAIVQLARACGSVTSTPRLTSSARYAPRSLTSSASDCAVPAFPTCSKSPTPNVVPATSNSTQWSPSSPDFCNPSTSP